MPRITRTTIPLLSAKDATGVGSKAKVMDYRHVYLMLSAALNSTLTVKFQGSIQNAEPDFGSAQSETNHWDYIAAYDLQDPSSVIPGDTGVALNNASVAANCRMYHLNAEILQWVSAEVTAYTDGNVTVKAVCAND